MCNCCTTCCYPFRLVEDLGLKGIWPQTPYVARYNKETCNYCGKCTKRCMFEAFTHTGSQIEYEGKMRKDVAYDAAKCFGCGLCANTCPTKSITMEKLEA
jgi:heterodisulfide reductase subunit A-like polyferredoxin